MPRSASAAELEPAAPRRRQVSVVVERGPPPEGSAPPLREHAAPGRSASGLQRAQRRPSAAVTFTRSDSDPAADGKRPQRGAGEPQPPAEFDPGAVAAALVAAAACAAAQFAHFGLALGWPVLRSAFSEADRTLAQLTRISAAAQRAPEAEQWPLQDTSSYDAGVVTPEMGSAGPAGGPASRGVGECTRRRLAAGLAPRFGAAPQEEMADVLGQLYNCLMLPPAELRMKCRLGPDLAFDGNVIQFVRNLPRRWCTIVGASADGFFESDILCTVDLGHCPRGDSDGCCALKAMRDTLSRVWRHLAAVARSGSLSTDACRRVEAQSLAEREAERRRSLRRESVRLGRRRSSVASAVLSLVEKEKGQPPPAPAEDVAAAQLIGLPSDPPGVELWQRALLLMDPTDALDGLAAVAATTCELRSPQTGELRSRQIGSTICDAAAEYCDPRRRRELSWDLRSLCVAVLVCMQPLAVHLDRFLAVFRRRAATPPRVFRAVSHRVAGRYAPGAQVIWPSFSPGTLSPALAEAAAGESGTIFIVCGGGERAACTVHFASSAAPAQLETLCPPGAEFEVGSRVGSDLIQALRGGLEVVVLYPALGPSEQQLSADQLVDRRLAATWESARVFRSFLERFVEPDLAVTVQPPEAAKAVAAAPPDEASSGLYNDSFAFEAEESDTPAGEPAARKYTEALLTRFDAWVQEDPATPLVVVCPPGLGQTATALALAGRALCAGGPRLAPVLLPWERLGRGALGEGAAACRLLKQLSVPEDCSAELQSRQLLLLLDGMDEMRCSTLQVCTAVERLRNDRSRLHQVTSLAAELQEYLGQLRADPVLVTAWALRRQGDDLRRCGYPLTGGVLAASGGEGADSRCSPDPGLPDAMQAGRLFMRAARASIALAAVAAVRAGAQSALLAAAAGLRQPPPQSSKPPRGPLSNASGLSEVSSTASGAGLVETAMLSLAAYFESAGTALAAAEGHALSPEAAMIARVPGLAEMLWTGRLKPAGLGTTVRRQVPLPQRLPVVHGAADPYRRVQITDEGGSGEGAMVTAAVLNFARNWHSCTLHACDRDAFCRPETVRRGTEGPARVHYRSLVPLRADLPGSAAPDQAAFWLKEQELEEQVAQVEACTGELRSAWAELTRRDVLEQLARRRMLAERRGTAAHERYVQEAEVARVKFGEAEARVTQLRIALHAKTEPLRAQVARDAEGAAAAITLPGQPLPLTAADFSAWAAAHAASGLALAAGTLFSHLARAHTLSFARLIRPAPPDAEPPDCARLSALAEEFLMECDMEPFARAEEARILAELELLESERVELLSRPHNLLQLTGLQTRADGQARWAHSRCVVTVRPEWLERTGVQPLDIAGEQAELWRILPLSSSQVDRFLSGVAERRAAAAVADPAERLQRREGYERSLFDVFQPLRRAGLLATPFMLVLALDAESHLREVCQELRLEQGPGLWELYEAAVRHHAAACSQTTALPEGFGLRDVVDHASFVAAAMLLRGRHEFAIGDLWSLRGIFDGQAAGLREAWLLDRGLEEQEGHTRHVIVQEERAEKVLYAAAFAKGTSPRAGRRSVRERRGRDSPPPRRDDPAGEVHGPPPRHRMGSALHALSRLLPVQTVDPSDSASRTSFRHRSLMEFLTARAVFTRQRACGVLLSREAAGAVCAAPVLRFLSDRARRSSAQGLWDGLGRVLFCGVLAAGASGKPDELCTAFTDIPAQLQRLADGAAAQRPGDGCPAALSAFASESPALAQHAEAAAPRPLARLPGAVGDPAAPQRPPEGAGKPPKGRCLAAIRGGQKNAAAGSPPKEAEGVAAVASPRGAREAQLRFSLMHFIGNIFLQHRKCTVKWLEESEGDLARGLHKFLHDDAGPRQLWSTALTISGALRLLVHLHDRAVGTDRLLPFHRVSRDGHLPSVRLYGALGCDPNCRDLTAAQATPLHHVRGSAAGDALLAAGADPTHQNTAGRAPLQCGVACLKGRLSEHAAAVAKLRTAVLRHDAAEAAFALRSLPASSCPGELLSHAAERGCSEIVKLLLAHGVAVPTAPQHQPAMQRRLLDAQRSLHWRLYDPLPHFPRHTGTIAVWSGPLHRAAANGHLACIRLLAAVVPGPAPEDSDGRSPLHHCALTGTPEGAEALIEAGAPPDHRDRRGATPLHLAAHTGRADVAERLLARGALTGLRWSVHRWSPLHLAAVGGHTDVIRRLLRHSASTTAADRGGHLPVHLAAPGTNAERMLMERMAATLLFGSGGAAIARQGRNILDIISDPSPEAVEQRRKGRSAALWATALLASPAQPEYYEQLAQRARERSTVATQHPRRQSGAGMPTPDLPPAGLPPVAPPKQRGSVAPRPQPAAA